MSKPLWRKNFDIKRIDWQMPYPGLESFYKNVYDLLGKHYLTKCIWIYENLNNPATYFLKKDLRNIVNKTLEFVLKKPKQVDIMHKKTIADNKKYFKLSHKIEGLALDGLTMAELVKWYKKIIDLQVTSHGRSICTTWFLDSDGEDFTKFLLRYLAGQIKQGENKFNLAEVFSVLTTPKQESLARKEEKELLILVNELKNNAEDWNIFCTEPLENLVTRWASLSSQARLLIERHYLRWRWTPYTYIGPAYELDYYLELIAGLAKEDVNVTAKLQMFKNQADTVIKQQKELFKLLKINLLNQHYFKIAQDIVFIKGYRKDCLYYGCFERDLILAEIAKRIGLSIMQIKYLSPAEVVKAAQAKKFNSTIPNKRMKFCVIYLNNGKNQSFVGQAAKKFLNKHKFEKVKVSVSNNLCGTCACPGRATGVVKVINLPEDMVKMRVGDIMLAHTTFPSLVPAMKKASAIVTEDGGITCHAAIVARELKIPCIVGVKDLLQNLLDGDMVEVDATSGKVLRK